MIENSRQKFGCGVTGVASFVGDDMSAGFSRRFEAVVASHARAKHFAVVHANGGLKGRGAMAASAIVRGREVSAGFAFGGCAIVATATSANHFSVIDFGFRRKTWKSGAMARLASI